MNQLSQQNLYLRSTGHRNNWLNDSLNKLEDNVLLKFNEIVELFEKVRIDNNLPKGKLHNIFKRDNLVNNCNVGTSIVKTGLRHHKNGKNNRRMSTLIVSSNGELFQNDKLDLKETDTGKGTNNKQTRQTKQDHRKVIDNKRSAKSIEPKMSDVKIKSSRRDTSLRKSIPMELTTTTANQETCHIANSTIENSNSEITTQESSPQDSDSTPAGRTRRTRGKNVNYKLPSLRAKMRRPTKKFVDATIVTNINDLQVKKEKLFNKQSTNDITSKTSNENASISSVDKNTNALNSILEIDDSSTSNCSAANGKLLIKQEIDTSNKENIPKREETPELEENKACIPKKEKTNSVITNLPSPTELTERKPQFSNSIESFISNSIVSVDQVKVEPKSSERLTRKRKARLIAEPNNVFVNDQFENNEPTKEQNPGRRSVKSLLKNKRLRKNLIIDDNTTAKTDNSKNRNTVKVKTKSTLSDNFFFLEDESIDSSFKLTKSTTKRSIFTDINEKTSPDLKTRPQQNKKVLNDVTNKINNTTNKLKRINSKSTKKRRLLKTAIINDLYNDAEDLDFYDEYSSSNNKIISKNNKMIKDKSCTKSSNSTSASLSSSPLPLSSSSSHRENLNNNNTGSFRFNDDDLSVFDLFSLRKK